ncbi:ankyrin repeat domain-containing protein [Roseateles sp. BYS78W]|uniref:Ankyrin repeat domain-containing protein n=1 Tax=Pelomonas candidula TaxID=3299025 RepID=A0ABW7HL04_9BURK
MTNSPERSEIFSAVLSSDAARLLAAIAAGANLNSRDHRGVTPLYFAITRGDIEIVEALLDAGADIEMPPDSDDPSLTPLRFAEDFWGLTEIGQLLRARGATDGGQPPIPPTRKTWLQRVFRPRSN